MITVTELRPAPWRSSGQRHLRAHAARRDSGTEQLLLSGERGGAGM